MVMGAVWNNHHHHQPEHHHHHSIFSVFYFTWLSFSILIFMGHWGGCCVVVCAGWLGRASFTSPEDAGYGSGSGFWLLDYLLMWIEVFVGFSYEW